MSNLSEKTPIVNGCISEIVDSTHSSHLLRACRRHEGFNFRQNQLRSHSMLICEPIVHFDIAGPTREEGGAQRPQSDVDIR